MISRAMILIMGMSSIVQELKQLLRLSIDSAPEKVSVFFKTGTGDYAEHDRFMGITVPTLRKIAKNFSHLILEELAMLLQSVMNEERLLALIILTQQYKISSGSQKEAICLFYRAHLHCVNNWNLVDSSAHLIIGAHLFGRNDCSLLDELAVSQNLWERRIAIVATWYFIRHHELDWTFRIASILKNDPHDLIHKAVGWMLREAGKKDTSRLISFLLDHGHEMPRTMLRYAMERLSQEQKTIIKYST